MDRSMWDRVDEKDLSCFVHVERMSGEKLTNRAYDSNVGGSRRGKPPKGWMKGVKDGVERR